MVGRQIYRLRKEAGINQSDLADRIGVSASTIGMYEQGRRMPSVDILVLLANIFDVSLDYLITGNEFPESKSYKREQVTPEKCPCASCYWKNFA